jgi:catechol 2,3-dioxygenase-like lactoylglutathione lyase family enzyme
MFDHILLTVSDLTRSIAFYEAVLPTVQITARLDYNGEDGPPGHPDLKAFGANGRVFFWLRQGTPVRQAVYLGFEAHSEAEVLSAHRAALAAGAEEIHPPSLQRHYDRRYFSAHLRDPDGHSLEFVFKSWQHAS